MVTENTTGLKPRNDLVLVKVVKVGTSESCIPVPETSSEGERYYVAALGPDVKEGLNIGDRILFGGTPGGGEWTHVPGHRDLVMMRQENILLVYGEDYVPPKMLPSFRQLLRQGKEVSCNKGVSLFEYEGRKYKAYKVKGRDDYEVEEVKEAGA